MVENIITAVMSSAFISGFFILLIRQYITKRIDFEFAKKEKILEHKFRVSESITGKYYESQYGIYPELFELIYRLTKIIEEGITLDAPYKWDKKLMPLSAQLTESLYKYRFFIDDDLFEPLHEIKHIFQDAVLMINTLTRVENVERDELYEDALKSFILKVEKMEALYSQIGKKLTREKEKAGITHGN